MTNQVQPVVVDIENEPSRRIIDLVNINELEGVMAKIHQFQSLIQNTLKQNHDYGVIPNTSKPTLLKPGAEKIVMLLGLRSEFEIEENLIDQNTSFIRYMVKCRLYRGDILITEGIGSCNSRENKFRKTSCHNVDNTLVKMAKKRALVDAALLVGSLSDIFTQDIEDMDLNGDKPGQPRIYTDDDGTITKPQAKRLFAIADGDEELVKTLLDKYGYKKSMEIKKTQYEKICQEAAKIKSDEPTELPEALRQA